MLRWVPRLSGKSIQSLACSRCGHTVKLLRWKTYWCSSTLPFRWKVSARLLQLTGVESSRSVLKKREFPCHPRAPGHQVPVPADVSACLLVEPLPSPYLKVAGFAAKGKVLDRHLVIKALGGQFSFFQMVRTDVKLLQIDIVSVVFWFCGGNHKKIKHAFR